jgi:D-glycero-D-manno-heptose 1,7-bisphosphate phosphatase
LRAVFLDRDGVINADSDDYIKSPAEWCAIPGSLSAIASLNAAGLAVIVISNQSGIARGFFDVATLNAIHDKMHQQVRESGGEITDIFYCPHLPEAACLCRKPLPGLLFLAQKKYGLNLSDTYFIGDSSKDIAAAFAAGCTPIVVRTGKGEQTVSELKLQEPITIMANLAEAAQFILKGPL